MTNRIDSIQIALPRAVTDGQQQQHAAQRMPVVAQEQAAAAGRHEAEAREHRPEAASHAGGGQVLNEQVSEAEDYSQGGRNSRRKRGGTQIEAEEPAASQEEQPVVGADGKGTRVDLRL